METMKEMKRLIRNRKQRQQGMQYINPVMGITCWISQRLVDAINAATEITELFDCQQLIAQQVKLTLPQLDRLEIGQQEIFLKGVNRLNNAKLPTLHIVIDNGAVAVDSEPFWAYR